MIKSYCIHNGRLKWYIYIILFIFPIICSFFAICIGRMNISPIDVIHFFISYMKNKDIDPMLESILINIRLPRIITALIVGAGLSAAGIAFQSIFSNPLATPDILGVSSASSFGAIIAIILSFNTFGIQVLAMLTGLFAVAITLRISKIRGRASIVMLVLSGLIVSSLANALSSLLKYTADPTDKLPEISYWLMGSFARCSYKNIGFAGIFIIIGLIFIYIASFKLNIMSLSDDEAKSLGVNVLKYRFYFIFASTLITAASISICGQVGWIGLIIPHMARMLIGSNNTHTLPVGLSFGAAFMVVIEALSRTISIIELPISILTAIIGAPIFIILLKKTGGSFK